MRKRRKFALEFKAKVALTALAGEHTLAELAAKYDIHPNMTQQWKRTARDRHRPGFLPVKSGSGDPLCNATEESGASHCHLEWTRDRGSASCIALLDGACKRTQVIIP